MENDRKMQRELQFIALSIDNASQALSKMIKAEVKIEMKGAFLKDISKASEAVMASQTKSVVGAFVDLTGDMTLKFLFYVTMEDSLILTDFVLGKKVGTTKELDVYTASCIQEMGNILASSVGNVFSSYFQVKVRPLPPMLVHDYAPTVFGEYIMEAGQEKNDIVIIESLFCVADVDIKCHMYLLPTGDTQKKLAGIMASV